MDLSGLNGAFSWLPLLFDGFLVTLKLTGLSLMLALGIGAVVGLARWAGGKIVAGFLRIYIDFARNTPPVVQILFWYFSASYILPDWVLRPLLDVGFEFAAATVAISLYHGAFIAEVLRASLNALPKGQFDAADALAFTFIQKMSAIILPQALRIALPAMANEAVSLVKCTSLAMAIGVTELTYQAKYIGTYEFRIIEALTVATALYFVTCFAISTAGHRISRYLDAYNWKRK